MSNEDQEISDELWESLAGVPLAKYMAPATGRLSWCRSSLSSPAHLFLDGQRVCGPVLHRGINNPVGWYRLPEGPTSGTYCTGCLSKLKELPE